MLYSYFWLLAFMILFSLLGIWLRAVLDVRTHGNKFSFNIFFYENITRMILCGVGDIIVSLLWFFEPAATTAVLEYLGFAWIAGAGAALGFVVCLLTVVLKKAQTHPLRQ